MLSEAIEALKTLKNEKTAGNDGLPPELLKYGISALAVPMFELLSRVWDDEKVPSEMVKGSNCQTLQKKDKRVNVINREASLYNQLVARFCAKLFSIEFKIK